MIHFLPSEMERDGMTVSGEDNPAFDEFVNGAASDMVPDERTPVNRGTKPV